MKRNPWSWESMIPVYLPALVVIGLGSLGLKEPFKRDLYPLQSKKQTADSSTVANASTSKSADTPKDVKRDFYGAPILTAAEKADSDAIAAAERDSELSERLNRNVFTIRNQCGSSSTRIFAYAFINDNFSMVTRGWYKLRANGELKIHDVVGGGIFLLKDSLRIDTSSNSVTDVDTGRELELIVLEKEFGAYSEPLPEFYSNEQANALFGASEKSKPSYATFTYVRGSGATLLCRSSGRETSQETLTRLTTNPNARREAAFSREKRYPRFTANR